MRSSLKHAAVASAATLALGACNAIMGPTPPDGNWAVYDRGRFTFHVRPDSFGEKSVDPLAVVLDDQFTVSIQTLGLRYNGRVTLFLHNSGADAGFSGDAGGGDHSGVAYPATETVKAVAVPPLDGNLMALLAHEVNHVILHNGLGRPGTSFVNEGLASAILSERYHSLGPTFYHHWVATHPAQVPPLANLIDDDKWREYPQPTTYATSASFLAYLIEKYPADSLRAVYPTPSASFASRFSEVYGLPLETAEAAWLEYCRGK